MNRAGGGVRYGWSGEGRRKKEQQSVAVISGVTDVIDPLSATEPQSCGDLQFLLAQETEAQVLT